MRIKVDEDLPKAILQLLKSQGYQADSVLSQGMSGWKDDVLWQAVQNEQRLLITADKGFADIRRYPPGTHYGVILLRPEQDGVRPVFELLKSVLNDYKLELFDKTITVVTPRGIRIRKPNKI